MRFQKLKTKNLVEVGVLCFVFLFVLQIFFPLYSDFKKVVVTIPRAADSFEIAEVLSQKKVIKSKICFVLLSRILRWEKDLKAGRYEFSLPVSMFQVLSNLKKGKVKNHLVTIPEGLPRWEIANIMSQRGIVEKEAFLKVVDNPQIFAKEGFSFPLPKDSLEGYLYPDTYYFVEGEAPEKIVKKFLSHFEEVLFPLYHEKGHEKDFSSIQEVIILASIVEKEAQISSEKPIIAAVFYNRLRRGMKLRADPTVKYALGDFRSRLTRDELKVSSPYNTYLRYGLPPGPICSPGRDSIYAVLHPAEVGYLYFVARGDGSHEFSHTYKQHLQAVYQYQKG